MGLVSHRRRALTPLAMLAMVAASGGAIAQDESAGHGEVMATVYGPPPADLSGLAEGPVIKGMISARNNERIRVTGPDGASTALFVSD